MRLARDRRGATGPEFAVASGVVFLLFCLVIDIGNLFAARHALAHGLDKATRYAAVRAGSATQSSVTSTFTAAVTSALGAAATRNCTVTVSYPSGNVVGGTIVVTASYPWTASAVMGVLPAVTLSARQTLTIQH
jgi:Flp pilus assembly protein TadG